MQTGREAARASSALRKVPEPGAPRPSWTPRASCATSDCCEMSRRACEVWRNWRYCVPDEFLDVSKINPVRP